MKKKHLITVDELRAMGALYVPPGWQKSLSARFQQPDLFANLKDDEEPQPDDQDSSPSDDDEAVDD